MAILSGLMRKRLGMIITAVLALAVLIFVIILAATRLVPGKILFLGTLSLLFYLGGVGVLLWNRPTQIRFVVGSALSVVMALILIIAGIYIQLTVNTLSRMTAGGNSQTAAIGVFVRAGDPAKALTDLESGAKFGILGTLDRANTDSVLAQIGTELERTVAPQEYKSATELMDSLVNDWETDVVIMNTAYLDVVAELEDYENIEERIRQIDLRYVDINPDGTYSVEATPEPVEEYIGKVYSFYISGSDTRYELDSQGRSDVNILAVLNTETRQALFISTPRDYYVPLSISSGVPDKLTHAGIYGVDVSMGSLALLYDVHIDYFFRLNFTGFKKIVDAVGGVDVYSDRSFTSVPVTGSYSFKEGMNHMNGKQALAFVRERKAFNDGDRQRGRNQMAVIKAIIEKGTSPEILMSYTALLDSIEGSFEMNIPYEEIAEVVRQQLADPTPWSIYSYSVTGKGDKAVPYSLSKQVYVMMPDLGSLAKAQVLIDKVRQGETITEEDLVYTEGDPTLPAYHGSAKDHYE